MILNKWLNTNVKIRNTIVDNTAYFPDNIATAISDGHEVGRWGKGYYPISGHHNRIIYGTGTQHKHATFCMHRSESYDSNPGEVTTPWYSAVNPSILSTIQTGHVAAIERIPVAQDAFGQALGGGIHLEDKLLGVEAIPLITSVWDKLKPDLTEVSVPNFLIDLDQIKSLWKLWKVRRKLLVNLANLNLNLQYGWRPTIGDVTSMVTSIGGLSKKLTDWDKSLGHLRRKRITVFSDSMSRTGSFTEPTANLKTYWSGSVTRKCVAHIAYIPLPIRPLGGLNRMLLGALDSLGFELNPGIIWDAIPFSFVVDWFLPLGKACNALKVDTLELPFELVDSYLQYKESYSVNLNVTELANFDHNLISYPGARYQRNFFHRFSCVPDWTTLLSTGWKLPSPNQVLLGLSLGLSRQRHT